MKPPIATDPDVESLLNAHAPVAIGVSGGKDSQAAALATIDHLNRLGHCGPRVLIHADLGSVEWNDSLPTCERLAAHLQCELIVVRRKAGGMMERWESRWASSVRRYAALETVTLVLPWSTPSMRFAPASSRPM
jgi:tRNA(Ile)-lysidine synthase TilS/MesJ